MEPVRGFSYSNRGGYGSDEEPDGVRDLEQNTARMALQERPVQAAVDRGFSSFVKNLTLSELISYEKTLEFFRANSLLLSLRCEMTQNTALHQVVTSINERPHKCVPLCVMLVVLMELGVDREAVNVYQEMAIDIALRWDSQMVVELLTLEHPSRHALYDLAKRYGHDDLVKWLEYEPVGPNSNNTPAPPVVSVEEAGRRLAQEIQADPVLVYERIFAYYTRHPELVTRRKELTGNTQLHEAVLSYAAGNITGVFEVLILLQQGVDKFAKNYTEKTALDLARVTRCAILVDLLQQDAPSKESLTMLALEYGLEELATWLTQ